MCANTMPAPYPHPSCLDALHLETVLHPLIIMPSSSSPPHSPYYRLSHIVAANLVLCGKERGDPPTLGPRSILWKGGTSDLIMYK